MLQHGTVTGLQMPKNNIAFIRPSNKTLDRMLGKELWNTYWLQTLAEDRPHRADRDCFGISSCHIQLIEEMADALYPPE